LYPLLHPAPLLHTVRVSTPDPVPDAVLVQSNAFNATSVVNQEPTVVPNERYCTPVVRFTGQTLRISDHVTLRPETAGFSFVAVFRQATTTTRYLLTRTNSQSYDYSLITGTQVVSLSQTGGGKQRSQRTRSMSDTTRFYVSASLNQRFIGNGWHPACLLHRLSGPRFPLGQVRGTQSRT
jgi:hypothetical protein